MNLKRVNGTTRQMLGLVQQQVGPCLGSQAMREDGFRMALSGHLLAVNGRRQDEAKQQLRLLRRLA